MIQAKAADIPGHLSQNMSTLKDLWGGKACHPHITGAKPAATLASNDTRSVKLHDAEHVRVTWFSPGAFN